MSEELNRGKEVINTRKLVSIKTATQVEPIVGADSIEVVTIEEGWKCVVKKGDIRVNDRIFYFEIDSFLPENDARFGFLMNHTCLFNGKKGHRLRTIMLRKQLSQGLALPLTSLFSVEEVAWSRWVEFHDCPAVPHPVPSAAE